MMQMTLPALGYAIRRVIPAAGSFIAPKNHCPPAMVTSLLSGINISKVLAGRPQSAFLQDLSTIYIPEATSKIVRYCRQNFDLSFNVWSYEGTDMDSLTLPYGNVVSVTTCYLRVLPSLPWYKFTTPRLLNGQEWANQFQIEPPLPPPTPRGIIPTSPPPIQTGAQLPHTGIEDADLLVDCKRRTIMIPPRVLYASLSLPSWNYRFFKGDWFNIEVHFTYGFVPTAYEDGQPLAYDANGIVIPTSPAVTTEYAGGAPIDWSSGMPPPIRTACARLAKLEVLRQNWYGKSGGFSSISVDGASESYGNRAYGGELEAEEQSVLASLRPFAINLIA